VTRARKGGLLEKAFVPTQGKQGGSVYGSEEDIGRERGVSVWGKTRSTSRSKNRRGLFKKRGLAKLDHALDAEKEQKQWKRVLKKQKKA